MFEFKQSEIKEVDIHKMQTWEAKYFLERLLANIDPHIKEVVVIHGYRRGNALRDIVRNDLRSNKIKRKFISLNPGVTSLIINL